MWNLPGAGIKPTSPAVLGETEPPGKFSAVFKVDSQQGPAAKHGELLSVMCSLDLKLSNESFVWS